MTTAPSTCCKSSGTSAAVARASGRIVIASTPGDTTVLPGSARRNGLGASGERGRNSSTSSLLTMVALAACMLLPDRTSVEGLDRLSACLHVGEATHPDEAVGIVEISEPAENVHPRLLLRLDELAVEELDQRLSPAGTERVPTALDHVAPDAAERAVRGTPPPVRMPSLRRSPTVRR